MSDLGWCTIESDPGVFTELLREIGVRNVQVEELYALDKHLISQFGQVYGLVFLFKYRADERSIARNRPGKLFNPAPESLFFANQTITNACATQALLSIVMNTSCLSIGEELSRFKDFSNGMDSMTKGMVVSNSEVIRAAHNSFAPQHQFVVEDSQTMEKEDPFHFVAYLPHDGKVFELDGLQEGPREHGAYDESTDWIDVVTPIITQRIEEYNGSEIRFNIMMVVEDPRERLQGEVEKLREHTDANSGRIASIEAELAQQTEKHDRWHKENMRRRWNFVPFIVNLFKAVAEAGQAEKLIADATKKKEKVLEDMMEK
ncbi:unnamed protein product [Agarophyton chilense]|eukprot:gb/GEZJ01001202.1/.p1 GENE.gb/GEZJ01001202.1/~~gb/GEZJ01001202.1/.p1  ORF type:complete len:317 (+),score=57.77 gb/GEZJ01001202.1/:187-1137(+)